MAYINKFTTQAAYNSGKYDLDIPAVSYIEETDTIVFDKTAYTLENNE